MNLSNIPKNIDFLADENVGAIIVIAVLSKYFHVKSVPLYVQLRKSFPPVENIYRGHFYYILKHMLCTTYQIWRATRGFDDSKCHLRDSTALQRVK